MGIPSVYYELPPEYQRALGQIVERFSSIELSIQCLIQLLSGSFDISQVDDRVMVVVSGEDFRALMTKLDKIFRYCASDTELITKFRKLRDSMHGLNAERNKYIHTHMWHPADEPGSMGRLKYLREMTRTGIILETEPVTLEMLNLLIERAISAEDELLGIVFDNLESIKSQWETRLKNFYQRKPKDSNE